MSAKRITFVKTTEEGEWADARFDVMLDGKKVAQVIKFEESGGRTAGGRTYYSSTWTKLVWEVEAPGYKSYITYTTRMDAVIDYLTHGRNIGWDQARAMVGKRGL